MAEGASIATAKSFLSALVQGTAFSYTELWCQLHVGPPGPDGTDNIAVETTRVEVTTCFGTPPDDDGTTAFIANDAVLGPWPTPAPATEDYTHVTYWSDETDASPASFAFSGQVTADPVTAGDDGFTAPIGDATLVFPVAT